MSETENQQETGAGEQDDLMIDELAMLKQRARMMGITFSNNIGVDALKEKIAARILENEQGQPTQEAAPMPVPAAPQVDPVTAQPVAVSHAPTKQKTLRNYLLEKEMKLVRLRITNLDPKKKAIPGEFITVANEYLGTW